MSAPEEQALQAQIQSRGSLRDEYEVYHALADNGRGGDITNGGKPLKTFEERLVS